LHRTVVVAVVAVRVVEVVAHQIVDMVTVGHRFVAAARAVAVCRVVAAAGVARRAVSRIGGGDGDGVLFYRTVGSLVVEVAVVQIVDVVSVLECRVAAAWAVAVRVIVVDLGFGHRSLLAECLVLTNGQAAKPGGRRE
jgi:hypothetical protein